MLPFEHVRVATNLVKTDQELMRKLPLEHVRVATFYEEDLTQEIFMLPLEHVRVATSCQWHRLIRSRYVTA